MKISCKPDLSEQGGFTKEDNEWQGKTSHLRWLEEMNNHLLLPLGSEI